MRVVGHAVVQGRQDAADRPGVDAAVGVAADAAVDRAGVQAGAAADALQALAERRRQHPRPAVVQQHQVELLRTVAGCHPGPGGRVGVHPLAGRGAGEQLQEDLEVLPAREHLLDPHHRDQQLGQRQAHAPVAL